MVSADERIDMKEGEVQQPYQRHQGQFTFRFSLVYTSIEDVLPTMEELCFLAQHDATKEERAFAKARLAEIIQEHEEGECFNPGWLEDDDEKVIVEEIGSCITALCSQPGRVILTQSRIYFQPFNVESISPIQTYQLNKVMFVMRRVYQLVDLGIEIFFPGRTSLYLVFKSPQIRDTFMKLLMQQPNLQLEHMRSREKWTKDWVNGRISNFDYLMYLNREAGRSFKDLTQYPVFPWVVADYTSPTLDLSDPATFRDLTRPIGALNPRRLKDFRERYTELKKLAQEGQGKAGREISLEFPPPFMYGCHYSSPGYVVFYLMRSDPQLMLRLQNGRFDAPDRLFWSIQDTWKSVLALPTDVKELIPEFYSNDATFLVNINNVDFGTRSTGQKVGDVLLPPWASDAQDFVYKLAQALECPYVSSKLHKWINLVFGYKSRGPAAEAADNVFHYLTYDEIATRYLNQEQDDVMREALRLQMMEFGRTPRQLFTRRHPKRKIAQSPLLACLACGPAQIRRPASSVNTLLGKGWTGRNITPVSRAVFKLTSKRQSRRAATLDWLEQAAARNEPDLLVLKQGKGAELVVLVKFVREARDGRNPYATGEEMTRVLVRACKGLAVTPQNRRYILDAGALDLLLDAMCSERPDLSLQSLQALATISVEEDPRMASLDRKALARVVDFLRHPPHVDAMLPALTLATNLARTASNRAFLAEHGVTMQLLTFLEHWLQSGLSHELLPGPAPTSPSLSSDQAAAERQPSVSPSPGSPRRGQRAGALSSVVHASQPETDPAAKPHGLAMRRLATHRASSPESAVETQRAQLLRQCAMALAALLQDDSQKDLVLGYCRAQQADACKGGQHALSGRCGLDLVLSLSSHSEAFPVQAAAYECLAELTKYDPMLQQVKKRAMLPMLLQAATAGPGPVQRAAAEAVANVCADPAMVIEALPEQTGTAALVAMVLSPDKIVQEHAARALWHLLAQPDTRGQVVRSGAINALLSLARSTRRGVKARSLARKALRVCLDDPGTRPRLETAAAAAGLNALELAAMLRPGGGSSIGGARLSSHPSHGSIHLSAGTSGSPLAGSGSSKHLRRASDLPSAADTDDTTSPLLSRCPSFSAALGSCGSHGGLTRDGTLQEENGASTSRLQPSQELHSQASVTEGQPAHPAAAAAGCDRQQMRLVAAEPRSDSSQSVSDAPSPRAVPLDHQASHSLGVLPNGQAASASSWASQLDDIGEGAEATESPTALPLISPVVEAASGAGSPALRWQQAHSFSASGAEQESPTSRVEDVVQRLEKLAVGQDAGEGSQGFNHR